MFNASDHTIFDQPVTTFEFCMLIRRGKMDKGRGHPFYLSNAVGKLPWPPYTAMLHCKIKTAKAKATARSIYQTIAYCKIAVVVSGKTIVAGAKIAIGNGEIIAKTGMEPVVPATNRNLVDSAFGAIPAIDGPVGRVFNGKPFQQNVSAIN